MMRIARDMLAMIGGVAFLSAGCSAVTTVPDVRRIELANAVFLELPDSGELTESFDATQLLVAEYGMESYSFQAQIESRPGMITIVGLTLLGGALFSITYDGVSLRTEGVLDAQRLDARYVLGDVLLSFWDSAWVREHLQGAILEVSAIENSRTISRGGETVVEVSYDTTNRWSGRAQLSNLERGYSLDIRTIEYLDL